MNLLDILEFKIPLRRVGSKDGVTEYHGPCPRCGTNQKDPSRSDRFSVKVNPDGETYWFCRNCGHGDTIAYLMKFEGMTFPAACKELGKPLTEQEEGQAPKFKRPAAETFTPRETTAPADLWIQHAGKLVDRAHEQLLGNAEQLAWLAARGLDLEAVKRYRLGWNPGEKDKDLYRVREAWGLPSVYKEDGVTKKKLWLPIGLTIPYFVGETLHRVRIRRPEGEPRYYLVPGSGTAPMIQGLGARAWVIVESELDALLIHHQAGDLTGAISQGNSTAKPDAAAQACLEASIAILVALDSDQAGMQASVWWKKHFPQAERWPVPVGKDPGEAYKAGIDIREWVKAGLPPALTLPPATVPAPRAATPAVTQDNSGASSSASQPEPETTKARTFTVQARTAEDGRTYHITNSVEAYRQLVEQGAIVFDFQEIELVIKSGADQEQAAGFLDLKQTFPGIRVGAVGLDRGEVGDQHPQWKGKYSKEQPRPSLP